ncbi:MAG: LacI family transcriptional regulator [Acidobacteria bacterium]|nr:LacI family transcriptional regulator [Acidobacteriota bacterium]
MTRRDVALRAGVSDAVVSYTLSGRAPVAEATAKRVREAIQELGYVPNVSAQALRSGSARAIALIAPATDDPILANPFFIEAAGALERAARDQGLALFISTGAPGDDGVLQRAQDFAARHVDGLVVAAGSPQSTGLETLTVPWVQLTSEPLDGAMSVGVDLYDGAVQATTHLIEHGHGRIGFIGESGDEARARGWRDACKTYDVEAAPLVLSGYGRDDGYAAGQRLLSAPDRADAYFAASDLIAVGVLRALHEHGVQVPEEVALVSFDGSWQSDYTWPRLTSVRQPVDRMATMAVQMLLDPTGSHAERRFAGELVVRESCGSH